MRNIMYTVVQVQCSVFVEIEQAIAPNGLLAAIERQQKLLSVKWPILARILVLP
jgi:hypothetical protein